MSWLPYAIEETHDGRFDLMPTFDELRARHEADGDGFACVLVSGARAFTIRAPESLRLGLIFIARNPDAPAAIVVSPLPLAWFGEPCSIVE